MKSVQSVAGAFVSLVAVGALVSACSGSSSTQSTAGGGGSVQAAASQGAASGGSGGGSGGGTAKATCSQLTAADVQGLMTDTVVSPPTITAVGTDSDGQQCVFSDVDSEQDVDIIVVPASDQAFGYDAAKQQATTPVNLPGVGQQAFRDGGEPTAEANGLMCTATGGTDTQFPGADKLVKNGTLDLTDAQEAIVATALGAVCNRIFGSGNTTPDLSGL